MFVVRNAGNLVPHSSLVSPTSVATEPGVLELACSINSVEHVVVCGHSDCKAMNLLHSLHTSDTAGTPATAGAGDLAESPLRHEDYCHSHSYFFLFSPAPHIMHTSHKLPTVFIFVYFCF